MKMNLKAYFFILIFFLSYFANSQDTLVAIKGQLVTQEEFEEINNDDIEGVEVGTNDLLEKTFFETTDITTDELFEDIREGLVSMEQIEGEDGTVTEQFEKILIDPKDGVLYDENEVIEVVDPEAHLTTTIDHTSEEAASVLGVGAESMGKKDDSKTGITLLDESTGFRKEVAPRSKGKQVELLELSPIVQWQQRILQNSRAVAVIVHRDRLSELTDSLYALEYTYTLGKQLDLCQNERYREQVSIGSGTAFLLDSSTLITAAHVFESALDEYVVIFRYEILNRANAIAPIIAKANVYTIKQVVSENIDLDIVKFELNRSVPYIPLSIEKTATLKYGEEVYMIGHPLGLPKKVALNAVIINNRPYDHFFTTLDAFQGNSGSPVFSLSTHKVIGVLVSGQKDFEWTGDCYKSTVCEIPYCDGEGVIRIQYFLDE